MNEFQKKGGLSMFEGVVSAISGLRENCCLTLQDTRKTLDEEETQD